MSLWRQLSRGVRVLRNRDAADQAIGDEVSHYLAETTAALMAKGLSPDEAQRAARIEMGSAMTVREEVRDYGWENRIDALFAGLRYALRRLAGNRGFSAVSVLTLALGIGASTAIFSVIDAVLLKPLPYPHPEQIVALLHTAPGLNIKDLNQAVSFHYTYSEENRVFQDVGMWSFGAWSVTGQGTPEKVRGLTVSNRFLAVLGVQPAFGRGFTPADDDPHSESTVLLSYGYWQSRFGGNRSVLGRRILLDGEAYTVIGVLPRSFQFRDSDISILMPFQFSRAKVNLISFCCQGIARVKPGVTLAQANADVARMLLLAPGKFPINPGWSKTAFADARIAPRLRLLKDVVVGDVGNTLWVLMGAVGIVLSIACANVANLLLVRADGRRQELAIRAALGAGWGRIAQELLIESVLLGLAGGAMGLALAWGALRVLVASELPNLPRIRDISIDPTVLAFTLAVAVGSGVLFGLIPVFKYARPQLSSGLRGGGRSQTWSRERHRARNLLVVVQVALAMVLLVGSGLMIRTFRALRHVDPGFSGGENLETMRIDIPQSQVKDPERAVHVEEEILRKIAAIGGVSAVAMTNEIPLEGGSNDPIYSEDQAPSEGGAAPAVRRFKFISPGYVTTMGSRLIAGRDLTWSELYRARPVALVSENMARELWRDPRAAIGKRIRATLKDEWREVIGVVADLRDDGIEQTAPTIVYWPLLLKNFEAYEPASAIRGVVYVVRTPRAGTSALRQEIQQAVASVNGNLPMADVKTLEAVYRRSLARTSFTLLLLAIAGGMALTLGVVGIYGVISYSVAQRTREVGIRLALGAPLREVTGLFVRQGLAMSGVGAVCGLAAALAATRLMKSVLFEVSPADPLTFAAASAALVMAAILGSYLPARRAIRVDPVEALRAE
jgi:putative ABC transport system permease protein